MLRGTRPGIWDCGERDHSGTTRSRRVVKSSSTKLGFSGLGI